MSNYVALLRGINVGGKAPMAMAALRSLFEDLGFRDVRTFIQSGNVIFQSPSTPVESDLEAAILERFKISTPVVVRSAAALERVAARDPFPGTEAAHLHVGFLTRLPTREELSVLDVERFVPERIAAVETEMYFLLPGGMGRSKLASYVNRHFSVPMTIRNSKTVTTLADLAAS